MFYCFEKLFRCITDVNSFGMKDTVDQY